MKKIVFFGGKGGVGKTSCASAYALAMARSGSKVLLVSTDPAHSTGDLFQCEGGEGISPIEENLYLTEIDPVSESERYLNGIVEKSKKIVSPVILSEIRKQIEAAHISPGTHEAALFERMGDIILGEKGYDYIVFDTAPTGHTMRLMNLPGMLGRWTETLIARRRKVVRLKEMKSYKRGLVEGDEVLKTLQRRRDKLRKLEEVLSDNKRCTFNLVMNPEVLALKESERALEELKKGGINLGAIVINKCLPRGVDEILWGKKLAEEEYVVGSIEKRNERVMKFYLEPNLTSRECIESMCEGFIGR